MQLSQTSQVLGRAIGTIAAGLLSAATAADEVRWINSAGGSFGDPGNWEGGHVPLAGDIALFDLPGPFTVTLDMPRSVGQITSTAGSVTLDLAGHELFVPNVYADAGELRVAGGSVAGAARASGGTLIVEGTASFDRGGGAGNGGTIIIRGVVGKTGDGQGYFSVSTNALATVEGGVISTRRLVVLGRLDMTGGWINGEISELAGEFNMIGGRLSGEHSLHNGRSFISGGAVIDTFYSVVLHGEAVIEGEGTVIEAARVHGDVLVRHGGMVRYETTGVEAGGRLTVGEGGVVTRVYCMDGGTVRIEPGAVIERLEAFGGYYTQPRYEVLVDGARASAFDAVQLSTLGPSSFDTEMAGTLSVEVVNASGLMPGQRIALMNSAVQPIIGAFDDVEVPTLNGRELRVVIEPHQVVLEVHGPAGCGTSDFNGDGESGTDADIEAFFACIAGSCCPTCGSSDFNGDGESATDADIEAFFRVLGGGAC